MNLRTLLGWSLAATLLAACSGGAGSVTPSNGNTNAANSGGNTTFTFRAPISMGGGTGTSSVSHRSPEYIPPAGISKIVYSVAGGYAIAAGPSTTFTYTAGNPGSFSGCTTNAGPPVTYSCNITLPASTNDQITLTLYDTAGTPNVIATGTSALFNISAGNSTGVAIALSPTAPAQQARPSLTVAAGSPTQFYNDGHAGQTITLAANELDEAGGSIITSYYGAPAGAYVYPTLTLTEVAPGTGNDVGITAPTLSYNTIPTLVGGNLDPVVYNGTGANTATLSYSITDATNTVPSAVSIPYISIATSAATLTLANTTTQMPVTITETATAGGVLDTDYNVSTSCGGAANVVGSPGTVVGGSPTTINGTPQMIGLSAGASTFGVTANSQTGTSTCTLTVASVNDVHLLETITIQLPGTAQVGVGSHSRI